MAFPKRFAELAARTRVAAGFAVAVSFFLLAEPCWTSLALGAAVGLAGLGLRAWAAGHLEKNQRLAVSGPYAHTRNPLYIGSLIAGAGAAVAGAHWAIAVLVALYFTLFFLPVVEEEERHLAVILPGYGEYAKRVPRLIPSIAPAYRGEATFRFSLYLRNREYQAAAGYIALLAALAAKIVLDL